MPASDINESRIMGIDYGEKRIGIALSDPTKTFAYAFDVLKNDKNFVEKLENLVKEKNVVQILLGLPSDEFESSRLLAAEVKKLKIKLEKKLRINIIFWDEEYSSVVAKEKIRQSVPKKSKRKDKGIIDSYSAALILQEFLDSRQYHDSS